MSGHGGRQGLFPLTLLLFSVGGVHFGVATDQVLGTTGYKGPGQAQGEAPFWFHRAVEFPSDPAYIEPTAVLVKPKGQEACSVIIDAMQEIIEVGVDEIQPFPAVLEPFARRKGLWGVCPRFGRMFLLVDLERLAGAEQASLS
ncbi:MAG: hypothetical protein A2051_07110 [Desulfovibrionales bacterium GWA2_65_9]|nr:MAG: hypothetical protein A2051_07110 [Desulfovibrionales bacterium GWA2_65_9]